VDTSCTTPGSCAFSGAIATACTQSPGYIGYFEIAKIISDGTYQVLEYDSSSETWYLVSGNQWIGFDREDTFSKKIQHASDRCYRGTMVWASDLSNSMNPTIVGQNPGVPPNAPPPSPTSPTPLPPSDKCCDAGETKMKAYNDCTQYYWCLNGVPNSDVFGPTTGVLFNEAIQNWDYASNFECAGDTCGGGTPGEPPTTPAPIAPSPPSPPSTDACCSYNYKDCNAVGWCSESVANCAGCSGTWLEEGALTGCIAKWGTCTNDTNGCCGDAECIGNASYRQCQ